MPARAPQLPVTTGEQATARDRAAMARGTASFDLMARAGTVTAAAILRDFPGLLSDGVAIFAGAGNNGGDGYVVAAQLARAGIRVRLHAIAPPRTDDAQRAAALVQDHLLHGAPTGNERLAIDAMLGTGHHGALRNGVRQACERLALLRDRGARVVALDLPSGLDAATGDIADGSVPADVTVAYGTVKRAHLLARHHVGRVLLADIGLDGSAHLDDGAWQLAESTELRTHVTRVPWDSWKTRRGRVAIVGGDRSMAGAAIIAARAALSAGAGLVHTYVHAASQPAVQAAVPQAITLTHDDAQGTRLDGSDVIAIGPGLGRSDTSRVLLAHLLERTAAPALVLDADALTLLAASGDESSQPAAARLAPCAAQAQVVCTPHPGEFARLVGHELPPAFADRVALVQSFAMTSRAVLLLKGTPTVIGRPDGAPPLLVARGTSALATGGSGDMLTGVIATLLAQGVDAAWAAALGAWLHGRAAEIAAADSGTVRGIGLDRIDAALTRAWREVEQPASLPVSLLAELPSVLLLAE